MRTQLTKDEAFKQNFSTDHIKANLKAYSVKGGVVTLTGQAVKFILNMGSAMILARLLTPADFGLIAMVGAFTGFVGLFKNLGLSVATIQRDGITHSQVSTLFWINVGVSILLAAIGASLAPLVVWVYREPQLKLITIAISCTFVFGGLSAQHAALLRRQMRFTALAAVQILSMAAGIASAIILAYKGAGYWALVGLTAFQELFSTVLCWTFMRWRPGKPGNYSSVRSLLAFGGNLTGFNLMNYFSRNADNFLIGWWWSAAHLGIYSKAYKLFLLPLRQVAWPLSGVAIPALSRVNNDPEHYRRVFYQFQGKLGLIIIPLMAFILIAADSIVLVILGPQWEAAISVFRWLGLVGIVEGATNSNGWVFISQNRTKEMFHWGILSSILCIASFIVGLPWGPDGVAASYGISGVIIRFPLLIWLVGRNGHISSREYLSPLSAGVKIAIVISFCCLSVKYIAGDLSPIYNLIMMICAAIFALLIAILVFKDIYESFLEIIRQVSPLLKMNNLKKP